MTEHQKALLRERGRRWRSSEKGKAYARAYSHRPEVLKYRREWRKRRYHSNPEVRAANSVSNREWRRQNLSVVHEYDRKRKLVSKFGITAERYEELLGQQKGVCALCGKPPQKKRLAVDHCHKTKKVRGLLCGPCNRALGIVENRMKGLSTLHNYLDGHVGPVDTSTLADGAALKYVKKSGNFVFS